MAFGGYAIADCDASKARSAVSETATGSIEGSAVSGALFPLISGAVVPSCDFKLEGTLDPDDVSVEGGTSCGFVACEVSAGGGASIDDGTAGAVVRGCSFVEGVDTGDVGG